MASSKRSRAIWEAASLPLSQPVSVLLLLTISFRILIYLNIYRPNRAKLAWEELEQGRTSLEKP